MCKKEIPNDRKRESKTTNEEFNRLPDDTLDNVIGGLGLSDALLRTLKEKAINAENDTDTEVDRGAIQKEIDASISQIDENALLTFNGKKPNNGSRT